MWQRRLKLGTYFSISVYVHWTFALLVAYMIWSGAQDGLVAALFGLAVLAGMFFCVTLHEYGHALTARRYGIETLDITLFPIGGVARLMKIPRVPWQEFLVAVAGPAVNVVIVTVLVGFLALPLGLGVPPVGTWFSDAAAEQQLVDALETPSLLGFVSYMILVNCVLILFNMIPAFPMDGGRVLRSLLAMTLEYRRATRIASNVGLGCAALMAMLAVFYQHLTPGLIAMFICYAGLTEARQVDITEPLRNKTVADAMIHHPPSVPMDTPLADLPGYFPIDSPSAVPVVAGDQFVIGMLTMNSVVTAAATAAEPEITAGEICGHDAPIFSADEPLTSAVTGQVNGYRQFAVVDLHGRLVGLLDLDTIRSRINSVT